MKRLALLLLCAFFGTLHANGDPVRASFDVFYDTLAPYGEWANVEGYGAVWHPADVDEDWAPYTDGYWAYTDAGWTWVSYEDWGGITYHYGRWMRVRGYGWCWVPGYEWGPAWVSWRKSDDYIGWAPLPPEARWRRGTGFGTWVDAEYDIGPSWYRFCRLRDFGAPVLTRVLLPPAQNLAFIEETRNITNITWREDRECAFNGGLDPVWLAPLLARPFPALRLVRNTVNIFTPGRHGNVFIHGPKDGAIVMAAPPPRQNAPGAPRKPPTTARSITTPGIDRGWAGAPNDPERARILGAFRQQLKGATPQTAPAKPFHPGLVTIVPKIGKAITEPLIPRGTAATANPTPLPPPPPQGTQPPPSVAPPVNIPVPAIGNRGRRTPVPAVPPAPAVSRTAPPPVAPVQPPAPNVAPPANTPIPAIGIRRKRPPELVAPPVAPVTAQPVPTAKVPPTVHTPPPPSPPKEDIAAKQREAAEMNARRRAEIARQQQAAAAAAAAAARSQAASPRTQPPTPRVPPPPAPPAPSARPAPPGKSSPSPTPDPQKRNP
ncbi:MAG: DUF6600 domain-containing protein [Chthoniobacteraceae bacterium]